MCAVYTECHFKVKTVLIVLQVAGLGHGDDPLLHPKRHAQGSVQKYSEDTQVFPDLCVS